MHFIVSWDIPSTHTNRQNIENQLVDTFREFPFVKPLTTYYIIKVDNQAQYSSIIQNLQNVGKTAGNKFKMLVSPIMNGGRYNGLHDNETWTLINQISG
jgi:hypothetical protein